VEGTDFAPNGTILFIGGETLSLHVCTPVTCTTDKLMTCMRVAVWAMHVYLCVHVDSVPL
jgi:hypothetical protein